MHADDPCQVLRVRPDRPHSPKGAAEGEGCALRRGEDGGQLVLLGFDVAVFAPAAYQRRSLRRPCEI